MTSLAFGRKLIVLTDFQFRDFWNAFGKDHISLDVFQNRVICKNAVSK